METLLNDVRYAARALRKAPGFTIIAVLTVALGISATTFIFSLISTLLLAPLPVPAPDRLVTVHELRGGAVDVHMGYSAFSFSRYEAYVEASREVFTGLAGHHYGQGSLRTTGAAEVVNTVSTTANYFDVLGLRPALGGFFAPGANPAAEPVAVISHGLWTSRFGADPDVLGQTVYLDSRPFTVIGVAPAEFSGTLIGLAVDVWFPAPAGSGAPGDSERLILFGRLRPAVALPQANAALEVVSRQVPPDRANVELLGVQVQPLMPVPADFRAALLGFMSILMATAGLVLLIASTNVGGMLLARGAARRREIAVRLAIGAGRGRVIQQLVTESVLLFLLGGATAVLLSVWLVRAASTFQPPVPIPIALEFGLDARVLLFASGVALVTGLVFGLAPALQATRTDLLPSLKEGERGQTVQRTRLRSTFVVFQLAMSLLLLIVAGLFVRTLQQALASEIGFEPDGVVVATINLDPHGYDEARGRALQDQLRERVQALPGVAAAAYAMWPPMSGNEWSQRVERADGVEAGVEPVYSNLGVVGSGYFETLQVPLVAGRGFMPADGPGAPETGVVNETLATRLWPGLNPIGRSLRVDDRTVEVIGVARDGRYETYTETPKAFVYLPLEQRYRGSVTLHVRSHTDPAATLAAIRRELAALDANIAVEQAMPLPVLIGFSIFPQRLAATMIGVFGVLGLLLAAIGLYGILAYQVAARTREIGIRLALGAQAANLVRMVMRQSLRLVLFGTLVGLAAAFGATRVLTSLLYGVTPTDPATFLGVPLLLAAIALLASYLPARRASRVDPMVALRSE